MFENHGKGPLFWTDSLLQFSLGTSERVDLSCQLACKTKNVFILEHMFDIIGIKKGCEYGTEGRFAGTAQNAVPER